MNSLSAAESPVLLQAGVAQVDITPDYPVRLSGFGFRRTESEGITQRIWAKALAIGGGSQGTAVLIATDNLGVPDRITAEVAGRLIEKVPGFQREQLAVTATHTHTAPMLKNVAPTLFGQPIPPEHQANIDRYTREFTDKLFQVALAAIQDMRASRVEWGIGEVNFAMNRRTKGGPVDHDLPVLVVRDPEGKPRAVYFSYACHCVTLSHNQISGDWAGYAMEHIEKAFPGTVAMASIGCGADANPNSGVTGDKFEVADDQGQQIANEVKRLLKGSLVTLSKAPVGKLTRIELDFAPPRTRKEWKARGENQDAIGYHARVNLARLDSGETLPDRIEYPIQTWVFGDQLSMVFLPGEVVVDYSLRLKREFDRNRLWINAYANDAPCYIPSERVLKEGGYEGGGAMIYYDKPQVFAPGLEQKIMTALHDQIPGAFLSSTGTEGNNPRSPDQARAVIQVKQGLEIELVASEPLVGSPVAVDWDASGRLWVCEMFDYPSGTDENWQHGGRIKRLEDTNHDGVYDTSVLFLDGLPFPTGVTAWGKGVLVCAAPDILYAEDTDGDGRADRVEPILTGFVTGNYQARVNSLSLGLDNWIYGANGLLGGVIQGWGDKLDIRGHDFRFQFPTGPLETVGGLTQQGLARDDWGRWFGCDNGAALRYYPHHDRYFRRNPHVSTPPSVFNPPGDFDVNRIYPISRLLARFNDPDAANRITSGCGLGIYRDTLLGEEYYHNTFTCEPVHNLVHRLVLEEEGVALRRLRGEGEAESEFLASSDNWFRPVQVRTGPDGALYVVDMYRFLIEHPRWIPAARLAKIDVRAGANRGRIYRLRPVNTPLRLVRDLTEMNAEELAGALDSPNGTERDRVHVEMLSRKETAGGMKLRQLAAESELPQVRLQALSVLKGLGIMGRETLGRALGDSDERVRSGAIRLGETLPVTRLISMTNDPSLAVSRQLAFSLGEWNNPAAGVALAQLTRRWYDQPDMRAAILSSSRHHAVPVLETVMEMNVSRPGVGGWLEPLMATLAGSGNKDILRQSVLTLLPAEGAVPESQRLSALATLLPVLTRSGTSLDNYFQKDPQLREVAPRLRDVLVQAPKLAKDRSQPDDLRLAAVRMVGREGASVHEMELLCELLTRGESQALRDEVKDGLRRQKRDEVAGCLLEKWSKTSPSVRQEVLGLLLDRESWSLSLLKAVQDGQVQPGEISLTDRNRLGQSSAAPVRRLAGLLWPEQPVSDRAEVLERYQESLVLSGRADQGALVFSENCSSCHALGGVGHAVGPDLASLRNRDGAYWLKNILDPNAVVEPRYVAYEIETMDDRSLSGIITTETATGFTLVSGSGVSEELVRQNIRHIRASSLSLMPEGLEQVISSQAFADLIAYLKPKLPSKTFPDHHPQLVEPDKEGRLILPATKAEIRGGDIVLEGAFKNIGMWHGKEDEVAWTFSVKHPGVYDLHLDYACAMASAGNGYVIMTRGQSISGKVEGTGADWSRYLQMRVGSLELEVGQHRLVVRAEGDLRGALIDLRSVGLTPAGLSPVWPQPTRPPDQLLRDPESIAIYLMNPDSQVKAGEAVIRANPQFAFDLIREMTMDMLPGSPEEYERIPWLWRVALACGKRDDPEQIRRVLELALPQGQQPLHDWQAVVLGGGIINGLSHRGHWPAERLAVIIQEDNPLMTRWRRALNLAVEMADNESVPGGTRYDALRMVGMDTWEKVGTQLLRYLKQNGHAEMQMGAVSGLGDMKSLNAVEALVDGMEGLTAGNRKLATEVLGGETGRATWWKTQAGPELQARIRRVIEE